MLTLVSVEKGKNEHQRGNSSLVFFFFPLCFVFWGFFRGFFADLCFRLENASVAHLDRSVVLLFLVLHLFHISFCCIKLPSLCFGEDLVLPVALQVM